jgi:hypothetical protein
LRLADAASAGAVEVSRAARSILRIVGIRTASPLCVSARVFSNVLASQTTARRLCRCAAVACRSLERERSQRWVTARASRFARKLQLAARSAYEGSPTIRTTHCCYCLRSPSRRSEWLWCAHAWCSRLGKPWWRALIWCYCKSRPAQRNDAATSRYRMIDGITEKFAGAPQYAGASDLSVVVGCVRLYLAGPASSPSDGQRMYIDKDTAAGVHVSGLRKATIIVANE